MRRHLFLVVLVSLAACGSGSATFDDMADTKWANTPDKCDTQFTTFDDGMIRLHYPDGTVDFGKIVTIADDSSARVMLTVEPTAAIKSAAQNKPTVNLPDAVTMGFEMKGERLHLPAMVGGKHGEIGGVLDTNSKEYRLFNLIRCPS